MAKCYLCPRKCGADRALNKGMCGGGDKIIASRASLHMWEEPCLSGKEGSGTVFFSGCNLGCIFCQNREISKGNVGKEISEGRLYEIFFELEEKGANNINLVTAGHFLSYVVPVIKKAKTDGLKIPFVYNTSSYESEEQIKMLDGLIDIYLPDFKYFSSEIAKAYSHAPDYPEVSKKAIELMVKQSKSASFDKRGIMQSGVIVRHLLLPGHLKDSKAAIEYLYDKYKDSIYISLMSQYTPICKTKYDNLNRKVTDKEYDDLVDFAISLGIENGFVQEGEAASESFIPAFDYEGI